MTSLPSTATPISTPSPDSGTESSAATPSLKIANPFARVSAKFLDFFIIMVVALLISSKLSDKVGPLVGILYSLCSDRLWRGQSIGKRVFRLEVRGHLKPRLFSLKDCVIRNAAVCVMASLAMVSFTGWLLLAIIGFPLLLIEIYLIIRAPNSQRLGDVLADTIVVHR